MHGANAVSTRSEEDIMKILIAAIPIVSARDKDKIIAWLREQCLLSESNLYKITPRADCPKEWPLGWKLSLETAIEKLKNSGGP